MTSVSVQKKKSGSVASSISVGAGVAVAGIWFSTFLLTALGAVMLFVVDVEDRLKQMDTTMSDYGSAIVILIGLVWCAAGFFTWRLLDLGD